MYIEMVSPKFHVQNNEFFDILGPTSGDPPKLSHWKNISFFKFNRTNHIQNPEVVSGPDPVIPYQDQQENLPVRKDT